MKRGNLLKEASRIVEPYCITKGEEFRLKDHDPADTNGLKDKRQAQGLLEDGIQLLSHMQEKLYAQDRWALLLIFQAMDAAGKDGAIKHVMSGVNPQGCQVFSFKSPSNEELNHDYLWRTHKCAFERYLTRNGVAIRKFFLHLSKQEQKRRFLERLEDSKKNWKFSMADVQERSFWKDYQEAYEEMMQHTATKHAPWYVIPADNKWFTRLAVAAAIIDALSRLDLSFPDVEKAKKKELQAVRDSMLAQKD